MVKLAGNDGTPVWARPLATRAIQVAFTSSGDLYVVDGGSLLALSGVSGETIWERPLTLGFNVAVDGSDNAIVASELHVYRYSPSGDLLASWCPPQGWIGGAGDFQSVTVDSLGRVYHGGAFFEAFDFGSGPIAPPFVVRFVPP